ncbi:TM2 domain-containing protein [Azorhizobium oxalatiphilum]|nr:TM2 domain-containing protein [Azorhizobium oxalatiphilum]
MLIAYLLHLMGGGGIFGFHRFYLGYTRSAQIQAALGATTLLLPLIIRSNDFQLFLLPPAMVWYIADLFLIPRMVRARNGDAGTR